MGCLRDLWTDSYAGAWINPLIPALNSRRGGCAIRLFARGLIDSRPGRAMRLFFC